MAILFIPLSTAAQTVRPADVIRILPAVPQAVDEVVHRTENDRDTLVQNILLRVRVCAETERQLQQEDSLRHSGSKATLHTLTRRQCDSVQSILKSLTTSLRKGLVRTTVQPSEALTRAVQTIGEQMDDEIKRCPKSALPQRATMPLRGPSYAYDSACVGNAEAKAAFNRRHEVLSYLSIVRTNWADHLAPLLKRIDTVDSDIESRFGNTTDIALKFQVREWRRELWYLVEQVLQTLGSVSQLASQFSK